MNYVIDASIAVKWLFEELYREGRDWLDQRDVERAAASGGLRKDLSHLDLYRS